MHWQIRLFFLTILLLLPGCSGKQSGDLGAFILQHAGTLGARVRQANDLPQFITKWYYKEDGDRLQIYLVGDQFLKLQSFLSAAFGQPTVTNGMAGRYYGAEIGVELSYRCEIGNGGKERVTSLSVVRQKNE